MYIGIKLKKALFSKTKIIRSDVSFAKGHQYTVLCLKESKTYTKHTSIQIVLITIDRNTCPVANLA